MANRTLAWALNRTRQVIGEPYSSLPTPYATGTVTVAASVTVTGANTVWLASVRAGQTFYILAGQYYHILSIESDTSLTLTDTFAGTVGAGKSYTITGGATTNATIVDNLNAAQWELVNIIKQQGGNYFATTGTISYQSGTASYALPTTNGAVKLVLDVTRTDLSSKKKLHYIPYQERLKYTLPTTVSDADNLPEYWSLLGENIIITPTPTTTATANVTIDYIPVITALTTNASTFSIKDDDMECLIYTAAAKSSNDPKITAERDRLKGILISTISPRQVQSARYVINANEDDY